MVADIAQIANEAIEDMAWVVEELFYSCVVISTERVVAIGSKFIEGGDGRLFVPHHGETLLPSPALQ